MNTNMFIHIGLMKTATTTLQARYFSKHPDLYYFGKPSDDTELYAAINHMCRADGMNYDPDYVRSRLAPRLEAARASGKVIGLSDEKITSHHRADRKLVAERIREQFGDDVKIVLTIRKQMGVIDSLYLMETRSSEFSNAYLRPMYWLQNQINSNGVLQTLDYYSLYRTYSSIFGKENVKVLLFEKFVSDRQEFLGELADFCGFSPRPELLAADASDNARMGQRWLNFVRFKKYVLGEAFVKGVAKATPVFVRNAFQGVLSRGPKAKVVWPGDAVARMNNLYVDGNRMLAQETGVDLQKYGYAVETVPLDSDREGLPAKIIPEKTWLPAGFGRGTSI